MNHPFPSTRYQGSKRKLIDWIYSNTAQLPFETALDVFGGTGAVSHLFKRMGKAVTYNDYLRFNWNIGCALIENRDVTLSPDDIDGVLSPCDDHPDFIQTTFCGVFFTDDENAWLDRTVYNIDYHLTDPYKRALARFALFQAALAKRPYNLFHRANLYLREAVVKRSFGNKATWDTPFEALFRRYADEANRAVFDNERINRALNLDAFDAPTGFDLVYLDPPYTSVNGVSVDYRDFYHFLEGMMLYAAWGANIEPLYKHKPLKGGRSVWSEAAQVEGAFEALIDRHRDSILVVSYRDDGIPTRETLIALLKRCKKTVQEVQRPQQYALSRRQSREILLIGM